MTTPPTLTRAQLGTMGEALAVDHLTRMGLRILHRNWRCRYGELDVIASDEATRTVVFVEVKTRTGDGYGGLAHAVTPRKVRRIQRHLHADIAVHLDVAYRGCGIRAHQMPLAVNRFAHHALVEA
ncbi:MAG: YraN family protein, partial [Mycobacterium sp.]